MMFVMNKVYHLVSEPGLPMSSYLLWFPIKSLNINSCSHNKHVLCAGSFYSTIAMFLLFKSQIVCFLLL